MNKFCKDCKFYKKNYFMFSVIGDTCINPKNQKVNLTTGEKEWYLSPRSLRSGNASNECGERGQWFEPK